MGRDTVKLRDIAAATGFSTNTVSLALRESPRIPEATRLIIKKAADELNYTPNQIAKSLVSRKSMTIGLVVTDILNPTLTRVAQRITDALSEIGYSTLFATSNNTLTKETEVISMFRGRQVDGILIYPAEHTNTAHVAALRKAGFPVVSLVADPKHTIDTVSINEPIGAQKATEHLIEMGHTEIGFLDAASFMGNTEKYEGHLSALKAVGLKTKPELRVDVTGHGIEAGHDAMKKLWDDGARPTAVLATNDSLALGIQRWCDVNGKSVPNDIAIVGFDNIEFARLANVPITTIAYPVERVATAAVKHLTSLIDTKGPLPEPTETLFEPDLLVRASSSN